MSVGGGNKEQGGGWQAIDQRVRRLARRRAALDVEEARLLIAAREAEVHRHLGLGSFDEYLERVLGYAPTTARDRMRVAQALEELPLIRRALQKGDLSFSAVREITRVAVPATEQVWLDAIADCNVREIEDSVRGRRRGDRPTDRPRLEDRVVRMELPPEVYALFIEARRHLEKVAGEAMTDAAFMSEVCRQALAGESAPAGNQPPHQIAFTVCVDCKRGWQDAGGRPVEVSAAAIERARCDAVELGRVDGAVAAKPTRSIPPRTRRMVLARDHHRCTVPGCRSSRFVDVHHIQWRSRRGDDEPRNLTTLCDAHHAAVHNGRLLLDGTAGALSVRHEDGRPYGAPPPLPQAPAPSTFDEARMALTGLGYRAAEASAAVASATAHVGAGASLEVLVRAALRECRRPRL